MEKNPQKVIRRRPAETGGVAGALALLVAHTAGLDDPNLIVALATVIGFLPAALTWLVGLIRSGGEPVEAVAEGA
jgi:hypothetical protein